jgi:hypothetical protein
MAGKREIRKNENPHLKKKSGTGVNGCNKNREKFCRSADENVQALVVKKYSVIKVVSEPRRC